MRNYFMYENKRRNNKLLIEYPKLFATDRHWIWVITNIPKTLFLTLKTQYWRHNKQEN